MWCRYTYKLAISLMLLLWSLISRCCLTKPRGNLSLEVCIRKISNFLLFSSFLLLLYASFVIHIIVFPFCSWTLLLIYNEIFSVTAFKSNFYNYFCQPDTALYMKYGYYPKNAYLPCHIICHGLISYGLNCNKTDQNQKPQHFTLSRLCQSLPLCVLHLLLARSEHAAPLPTVCYIANHSTMATRMFQ